MRWNVKREDIPVSNDEASVFLGKRGTALGLNCSSRGYSPIGAGENNVLPGDAAPFDKTGILYTDERSSVGRTSGVVLTVAIDEDSSGIDEVSDMSSDS